MKVAIFGATGSVGRLMVKQALEQGHTVTAFARDPAKLDVKHAMETAGVRRLVCQSSLGVGDSRENLSFFWKHIMFGMLLRQAYADHVSQENHVVRSRLDWTIVRPGAFTDGPRTGEYRHGFASNDKAITHKISRADVADFMLKQLTDDSYLHRTPGLSY